MWPLPPPDPTPGHPVLLSTVYAGDRFVLRAKDSNGSQISMFTDSAGGIFLKTAAARRLGLSVVDGKVNPLDGMIFPPVPFPLTVTPDGTRAAALAEDGMLGMPWFAARAWTFDYPAHQLWWRAVGDLPQGVEMPLYFQTAQVGRRSAGFARVQAEIDHQTIDFLLDTGATDVLPERVRELVGDGAPAERATSFMTESLFNTLRERHPDWRVIALRTRTGSALFEVRSLKLGGLEAGPAWFSIQRDEAFHQYMAQWMDHPTEGALGGSVLRSFRLSADWPGARAVIERRSP